MATSRTKRRAQTLKTFRRHALGIYPYCQWCRCRLIAREATTDHLIPLSRGGGNGWDNLCLACLACNQERKNNLPQELPSGPRWRQQKPVRDLPPPTGPLLVAWTRYPGGRWRRTLRGHSAERLRQSVGRLVGKTVDVVFLPEGEEPGRRPV